MNSVNILSALLRHQLRETESKPAPIPADVEAVLKELSAAASTSEKHAILTRVLHEHTQVPDLHDAAFNREANDAKLRRPSFVMSNSTIDGVNTLSNQAKARHWEAEAIIQAIVGQIHDEHRLDASSHLAIPFKPTSQDIERAIETLGFTPRHLFPDSGEDFDGAPSSGVNGAVERMLPVAIGLVLIVAILIAF